MKTIVFCGNRHAMKWPNVRSRVLYHSWSNDAVAVTIKGSSLRKTAFYHARSNDAAARSCNIATKAVTALSDVVTFIPVGLLLWTAFLRRAHCSSGGKRRLQSRSLCRLAFSVFFSAITAFTDVSRMTLLIFAVAAMIVTSAVIKSGSFTLFVALIARRAINAVFMIVSIVIRSMTVSRRSLLVCRRLLSRRG